MASGIFMVRARVHNRTIGFALYTAMGGAVALTKIAVSVRKGVA